MWISDGFASRFAGPDGANFKNSENLKEKFASDPAAHLRYFKMLDGELGKRFNFNLTNSPEANQAIEFSRKQMEDKLKDRPDLIKKLIPTTLALDVAGRLLGTDIWGRWFHQTLPLIPKKFKKSL